MPLKCNILATYASDFMCTYETMISVHISHINSMQSITWPEALVYIHSHYWHMPLNKCVCHIAHSMSHYTSTLAYIQNPHYCTHPSKINKHQHLFTTLLQNRRQQQIYLQYEVTPSNNAMNCCTQTMMMTQHDDNAIARLRILSWLLGQTSLKA